MAVIPLKETKFRFYASIEFIQTCDRMKPSYMRTKKNMYHAQLSAVADASSSSTATKHVPVKQQNMEDQGWLEYKIKTVPITPSVSACKSAYLRLIVSKVDTAVMPTAMAPRTTPPATTEESKFFRDGVTAASATRGLAIIAATPTVTPAIKASALLSFCWALQTDTQLVRTTGPYQDMASYTATVARKPVLPIPQAVNILT